MWGFRRFWAERPPIFTPLRGQAVIRPIDVAGAQIDLDAVERV
jgi:hypothetical protein